MRLLINWVYTFSPAPEDPSAILGHHARACSSTHARATQSRASVPFDRMEMNTAKAGYKKKNLKFLLKNLLRASFPRTPCHSSSRWSEVIQSWPTLCDPIDCSLPGSSIHGIFQARILEWVAISFSKGSSWPRDLTGSPALQVDSLPSEPPAATAAAKSLQPCPTLCDPIDGSPLGSSVPGILQARILEWVAISFSNAWKWKVKVKSLSLVQLLATLWTEEPGRLQSMGFSSQEYWSGVPLPSLLSHQRSPKFEISSNTTAPSSGIKSSIQQVAEIIFGKPNLEKQLEILKAAVEITHKNNLK